MFLTVNDAEESFLTSLSPKYQTEKPEPTTAMAAAAGTKIDTKNLL